MKRAIRHVISLVPSFLLGGALLGYGSYEAYAASGSVHFWTNLTTNNACVIYLGQTGELGQTADATMLSSKIAGGRPATAQITSLSRYWISVDGPTFFRNQPSGGSDNATFTITYSAQSVFRGLNFGEIPGSTQRRLNNGYSVTNVTIHLVAEKPDGFPAGNYMALTTVRCE